MFLRVEKKKSTRGFKRVIILQCDFCDARFERRYSCSNVERYKLSLNFCSQKHKNEAEKKGGILDRIKRKKCLEKHGVETVSELERVKEKRKMTCLNKYGHEYALQHHEVIQKRKQTNLKKYGYTCSLLNDKVKNKSHITKLERYGDEEYRGFESMQQTLKIRYGVSNPVNVPGAKEKRKETCLERFGVDNPGKSSQIMEKVDWESVQKKRHETMKTNKSFRKMTKPEKKLLDYLLLSFDKNEIERERFVKRWPIDFYVKPINLYIQCDGVYWHGLDRTIEEIRQFQTDQDKTIYKKMMTDKKQNQYFKKHGLKLVRLTDKQILSNDFRDLESSLSEKSL